MLNMDIDTASAYYYICAVDVGSSMERSTSSTLRHTCHEVYSPCPRYREREDQDDILVIFKKKFHLEY